MSFELRHLRAFLRLAETRHFGLAAEALGVSQPALSQTIRALEDIVGTALLDRRQRRVTLTAAGSLFLPEAVAALEQAELALRTARRAGRGEAGLVEIGYVGSVAFSPLFAAIIRDFRAANPATTLRLTQLPSTVQLERIAQSSLDCGFLRTPLPALPRGLVDRVLARERLVAVIPAGHRHAQAGACALAEFAAEPFIQYQSQAGGGLFGLVAALCEAAGFVPRVAQTVPQIATMICLVRAGLGIAVVPETMTGLALDGVAYVPLTDAGARTELHLVGRHPEAEPAIRAFVGHAGAR